MLDRSIDRSWFYSWFILLCASFYLCHKSLSVCRCRSRGRQVYVACAVSFYSPSLLFDQSKHTPLLLRRLLPDQVQAPTANKHLLSCMRNRYMTKARELPLYKLKIPVVVFQVCVLRGVTALPHRVARSVFCFFGGGTVGRVVGDLMLPFRQKEIRSSVRPLHRRGMSLRRERPCRYYHTAFL